MGNITCSVGASNPQLPKLLEPGALQMQVNELYDQFAGQPMDDDVLDVMRYRVERQIEQYLYNNVNEDESYNIDVSLKQREISGEVDVRIEVTDSGRPTYVAPVPANQEILNDIFNNL